MTRRRMRSGCGSCTSLSRRIELRAWVPAASTDDGLLDIKGVSPPRHFCPPDAHEAYRARILEVFGNPTLG